MNVAIYARVSSDRQAEKEISIPAQVKAIQQYCQERGYTVVQEFIEKGKSAKTDDREEFQKMIALAKRSSRSFNAILVHKFDRFSRKRDDHVIYKALLAQVGVKVISVTEQTDADTPQDKLLEGILEVMSEFFNANLAAEVRKGMKQNAKMGFNNGGTAPYGYRTEHMALAHQKTKAVWVLGTQEEIEIIRWIFNQYAYEGMGYTKIAAELNRQQIPAQKGGTWSASTIRAIIFNESYMGRRCWNKQDYQTKGKKWRDRSEWVITENAHPAIITKELFEKCQIVAKERHKGGGETHKPVDMRATSPFWLRGVMTCDKCGSPLVGNSTSSKMKGGRKQYYVCGGYMRKGKDFCSYVGWNKNRVEELVSNRLRLMFMQLLMQNGLEQEIKNSFNERNQYKLAVKENLENEVSFLLKRISLIQEDIQAGKAKSYHHEMLSEIESDLQNKTKELQAHSESWSEVAVPEELIASIKYDLQAFLSLLDQEVPNVQLLHTIAKKFISRLCINRDTGKLYLTLRLLHEQSVIYEKTLVAEWK